MRKSSPMLIASVLVLVSTSGLSLGLFGGFLKKELFFCWLVNFFNAYLSALICKKAVGAAGNSFLAWALLGHGLRFGLLVIAIFYAIVTKLGDPMAIVALTLTGYIIFMVGEVLMLHQMESNSDV